MPVSGVYRGFFPEQSLYSTGSCGCGSAGHMQPSKVFAAVDFLSIQSKFKFLDLRVLSWCPTSVTAAEQQQAVFHLLLI